MGPKAPKHISPETVTFQVIKGIPVIGHLCTLPENCVHNQTFQLFECRLSGRFLV